MQREETDQSPVWIGVYQILSLQVSVFACCYIFDYQHIDSKSVTTDYGGQPMIVN